MNLLITGKKMFKSRHIIKGCCRCKLTIGHKNKEGTLIFKNYIYTSNILNRKTNGVPKYFYNVAACGQQHMFLPSYDPRIRLLVNINHSQSTKYFHTSNVFASEPKKASSKVEETTEALKEKAKEITDKGLVAQVTSGAKKEVAVVKKPLYQKIVDELKHYYHGFRLLFIDIRVSSTLVWKVLRGGTLTRREYNLLIRTVGDMFRLVPFSIFIIVPFMELLLPVFIKLFPGMLPSTFQTATEKDDKMKQSLKVKLEMAKFLQHTLDEMAVTGKGHSSKAAKEFIEFFEKVRTVGGGVTSNEEILKFSKLFEDEITLDALTRSQLMALCRVLDLQPFGTTNLLRFQLRMKLRSLAADDLRIMKEGLEALTQSELQSACRARGMRALGMSEERLRAQLSQWLDLSLNEKVPPSLLLLSRAFMLPETITTTEKLVATISALPETVATKTKVVIGEREGKVDHKTKIDLIKEEVAKIQEEKKEEEEATEIAAPKKVDEILVDKAPILKDTATILADKPKEDKDLSTKDIGEALEDVLDTVGKDKMKMIIEKEELDDLKEEMKDYQEDVQNLKEVTILAKASDAGSDMEVKESKAAKRLSRTVNKMIMKMDAALSELEEKELAKKESLQKEDSQGDELLKVDELIKAIHKLQKVPDSSRLESIIQVLGKIDADKDGVVKVDDVLKILEVIGRENIKLKEKQIDEIIELLKNEEEVDKDNAENKTKDLNRPKKENANMVGKDNVSTNEKQHTVDGNKKDADENVRVQGGKNEPTSKNTGTLNISSNTVESNKYSVPIPPTDEFPSPSTSGKPPTASSSRVEKKANGPVEPPKKS